MWPKSNFEKRVFVKMVIKLRTRRRKGRVLDPGRKYSRPGLVDSRSKAVFRFHVSHNIA